MGRLAGILKAASMKDARWCGDTRDPFRSTDSGQAAALAGDDGQGCLLSQESSPCRSAALRSLRATLAGRTKIAEMTPTAKPAKINVMIVTAMV